MTNRDQYLGLLKLRELLQELTDSKALGELATTLHPDAVNAFGDGLESHLSWYEEISHFRLESFALGVLKALEHGKSWSDEMVATAARQALGIVEEEDLA